MTKTHTIDASGIAIGRTASVVAKTLIGKEEVNYTPNIDLPISVRVTNASKAKIDLRNFTSKTFAKYSGYPGGLTKETLAKIIEKKGYSELFRLAVYGMLPNNRLRADRMSRLIITE